MARALRAALALLLVLGGCGLQAQGPRSAGAAPQDCALPPLRTQVAQLIMVGFTGTEGTGEGLRLAREGVGGLILFSRNVGDAEQVRTLIRRLQATAEVPLEIGVDQEPGRRVSRLAGIVPSIPPARELGSRPPEEVGALATEQGEALAALGVTTVYAPVLDVVAASVPADGVIGDRSFGGDPDTVRRAGVAYLRGLRAGGVNPVAKHFPGHGASTTDSHEQLPVVTEPLTALERRDLPPFEAAVAAGVPAVMVGHLLVTDLDPDNPASLSPAAVRLLREQLGFTGVIVTDALEMGAISGGRAGPRNQPAAAAQALAAGSDQLLLGADATNVTAVIDHITAEVEAGRISPDRVRAAFLRVQQLKPESPWSGCA